MTESQSRNTGLIIIAALFLFGVIMSAIINFKNWDLIVSGTLHEPNLHESGWLVGKMSLCALFYRFGEYPAIVMALIALFGYILTRFGRLPSKYSNSFLVIVLTVILGPGLLVNGILKPFWGRPRPADIAMFGGNESFRSVIQPTGPGGGKSFVCGHCANAFAIASGVAFYPYFPTLAFFFLGTGLTMGIFGCFVRIAQGGHFLSDTLWAGIIVFSVITWLYFCLFKLAASSKRSSNEPDKYTKQASVWRKRP
ncbi:MAG: phosphatase PAP2 family protein [Desulfomonilaceae bacterium]